MSDQENLPLSDEPEPRPMPADDSADTVNDSSEAEEPAEPAEELDEPAEAADEPVEAADEPVEAADEPEEEESGSRRPSLAVIIGSALLLVAIGVGLGTLIPSGPPPEPLLPTAVPLPTALPLPEAIGEIDSTEPIVRVGDTTIPRGDFVRLYQPGIAPEELLNQLIMRELVVQAAGAEGVEVDEETVSAQVEQLRLIQAGGDAAQFATFLSENGIGSEENLRRLIGRDLLIEQMVLRHTIAEQARARHILLAATGDELEARKAEAEELLAQIENGGDFAALAQANSDDGGSKEQGGDLGWAPRGVFVDPFDEAVFSMEVGELRLVQTDFGWHIIELLEAPEVRPFESMQLLNTPIGQQAFNESFLPWADKLKADAEAANQIEVLVDSSALVRDPAQP